MKRKIGVLLTIAVLAILPIIIAGTTQIDIKSEPGYKVQVYLLDPFTGKKIEGESLQGYCNQDGLLSLNHTTTNEFVKLSLLVQDRGNKYLEFERKPLIYDDVYLGGKITIDLNQQDTPIDVIKENEFNSDSKTNETTNETGTNENETTNSSTIIADESARITGNVISDKDKNFNSSKVLVFIIIGMGLVFLTIFLVMGNALKNAKKNHYPMQKIKHVQTKPITHSHKPVHTTTSHATTSHAKPTHKFMHSEPIADKELIDAERKLEEVQRELLGIKEKRRKTDLIKRRIEHDKKTLRKLGEEI